MHIALFFSDYFFPFLSWFGVRGGGTICGIRIDGMYLENWDWIKDLRSNREAESNTT